jgi:hypothetical protein
MSLRVLSAHAAVSGSQSWKRCCTATASSFVGSFPTQAGQNISGFACNCPIGLLPISGTKAARNTLLETEQCEGRSGRKIPLTEWATTMAGSKLAALFERHGEKYPTALECSQLLLIVLRQRQLPQPH